MACVRRPSTFAAIALLCAAPGCSPEGRVGGGTSEPGTGAGETAEGGSQGESGSAGEGAGEESGSGADGSSSSTGATGATSASTGSGGDDGFRLDVGSPGDGSAGSAGDEGGEEGGCGCPDPSPRHFIWVANSMESTVSKIDVATMVEEGRYRTHPGSGDPSRTSVEISGRSVAVANRNGGVAKIWANPADCFDADGNGTIETSHGPSEILPWGQDECVAWFTDLAYSSNRPVAWSCFDVDGMEGPKVWTSASNGGNPMAPGVAEVFLLEGETGAILRQITVPEFETLNLGPYGGAADSTGNFWVVPNGIEGGFVGGNVILKVSSVDFSYEVWPIPFTSYGITVDREDNPWVTGYGGGTGVARFRFRDAAWDEISGIQSQSGLMQDREGRVWFGTGTQGGQGGPIGVYYVDATSLTLSAMIPIAGGEIKGVSVDVAGKVWAINNDPGYAYRIDPDTMMPDAEYQGLTGPYTYSDMTGWAIQNTTGCRPPPPG